MKTAKKRAPGRPKATNPKSVGVAFRVDEATAKAIEAKRVRMGVHTFSLSDTVREMTMQALKSEGLL